VHCTLVVALIYFPTSI